MRRRGCAPGRSRRLVASRCLSSGAAIGQTGRDTFGHINDKPNPVPPGQSRFFGNSPVGHRTRKAHSAWCVPESQLARTSPISFRNSAATGWAIGPEGRIHPYLTEVRPARRPRRDRPRTDPVAATAPPPARRRPRPVTTPPTNYIATHHDWMIFGGLPAESIWVSIRLPVPPTGPHPTTARPGATRHDSTAPTRGDHPERGSSRIAATQPRPHWFTAEGIPDRSPIHPEAPTLPHAPLPPCPTPAGTPDRANRPIRPPTGPPGYAGLRRPLPHAAGSAPRNPPPRTPADHPLNCHDLHKHPELTTNRILG